MGSETQNFYLQYPLRFRSDHDIKRLERKYGIAAPMIFLELNAFSADKGFVVHHREEDESFAEQMAIDLNYDADIDLVANIINDCIRRKLIEVRDDGETYYFPWAERQTQRRSLAGEKQARYRERKAKREAESSPGVREKTTSGNNCYQSVTDVLPDVTEALPSVTSTLPDVEGDDTEEIDMSNKRYHSKNKNKSKSKEIEAELEEEKEKEPIDRHRSRSNDDAAPTGMDLLVDIPLPNGKSWRPDADEYERMRESYPSLDIVTEFNLMRAWCQRGEGGCYSGASVSGFAWRWLERESQSRARQEVSEERERKRKGRSSADIWEDLARRVDNGEFG